MRLILIENFIRKPENIGSLCKVTIQLKLICQYVKQIYATKQN